MLQIPLVQGIYNKVETTIDGQAYTFEINWNDRFGYYSMNIILGTTYLATGIVLVSGVDIFDKSIIPLSRCYCVNKNEINKDFGYEGLADSGIVVILEDSDMEE